MGLIIAECVCVPAFIFEISRAIGGNELSWAYVFEWPLFGGYAIYMWHRLLQDERGVVKPRQSNKQAIPEDDAALDAWNAYLRQVHGDDSPKH